MTELKKPSVRWWPVVWILVLSGLAFAYIWGIQDVSRQDRNIHSYVAGFLTLVFLLLWAILMAGFRSQVRFTLLGTLVLVGLFFVTSVRIRGVTGDLFPILEFKWSRRTLEKPSASSLPVTPSSQEGVSYPQYLGPHRNGVVPDSALPGQWWTRQPRELWRQAVGTAWSGFAVEGGRAITQEQRGNEEWIICYHLQTGQVLWSHSDAARYFSKIGGEGPRATPTISEGRVYALGSTGLLNCLDLDTGKQIWSVNVATKVDAEIPEWGFASSPLVLDQVVVVSAGGSRQRSLVAFHKKSGEFAWGGGDAGNGYSSPTLVTLDNTPQLLIFNGGGVFAHSPTNGQVLWHYPWKGGHPHITMPIALPNGRVLISSGYGTGSELVSVRQKPDGTWQTEKLWKAMQLKSKFANLIFHEGFIYGLDDGIAVCLNAEDGKMQWKEGRYGHGQIIQVGKVLLIMAENGEVVFLELNPREHREYGRMPILSSKTWNPPALAGKYLVLRNDQEAVCLEW